MLLVGRLLAVQRPLAGVLNGQCRHDDQHLARASVVLRGQHHPGQPRVDRQLGQLAPERGERALPQRAQLAQQVHAVADAAPVRRLDERERLDVAEVERGHLQDDRGEVGAQDLRIGELRPGVEVHLEYSRMQMPSDVRPHRPLRWFAEACEIGSIGSRCTFSRWL